MTGTLNAFFCTPEPAANTETYILPFCPGFNSAHIILGLLEYVPHLSPPPVPRGERGPATLTQLFSIRATTARILRQVSTSCSGAAVAKNLRLMIQDPGLQSDTGGKDGQRCLTITRMFKRHRLPEHRKALTTGKYTGIRHERNPFWPYERVIWHLFQESKTLIFRRRAVDGATFRSSFDQSRGCVNTKPRN